MILLAKRNYCKTVELKNAKRGFSLNICGHACMGGLWGYGPRTKLITFTILTAIKIKCRLLTFLKVIILRITILTTPPTITHKITTVSCVPPLLAKSFLKFLYYRIIDESTGSLMIPLDHWWSSPDPIVNWIDFGPVSDRHLGQRLLLIDD